MTGFDLAEFLALTLDQRLAQADALLQANPQLAADNPVAWAALGQAGPLAELLQREPEAATRRYPPHDWTLLLHVCFSPFHKHSAEYSAGLVDCARLLLEHGADPNAAYDSPPPWQGSMQTCLYGATGHGNHPALAQVLLEAGANPDDDESLYHSAEYMFEECLALLLEHGVDVSRKSPHWSNTPLYFLLGYHEHDARVATADQGVAWLLEHGADVNVCCGAEDETALHLAARHNRRGEIVQWLLQHGADATLKRGDGRTAYALAVRHGNAETAQVLRGHGADAEELAPVDALLGCGAQGDLAGAQALLAQHTGLWESLSAADYAALPEAADAGRTDAVRTLLALGFPPGATGRFGATALHLAAFRGDTATIALLLEHAAPLEVRDPDFHATPLGWCVWASTQNPYAQGDYPGTARLLRDAGAQPVDLGAASPAVRAVLEQ